MIQIKIIVFKGIELPFLLNTCNVIKALEELKNFFAIFGSFSTFLADSMNEIESFTVLNNDPSLQTFLESDIVKISFEKHRVGFQKNKIKVEIESNFDLEVRFNQLQVFVPKNHHEFFIDEDDYPYISSLKDATTMKFLPYKIYVKDVVIEDNFSLQIFCFIMFLMILIISVFKIFQILFNQ